MMQTTFDQPMTEAEVSAALDAYAANDPEARHMRRMRCKNYHILAVGTKATVPVGSGCLNCATKKAPLLNGRAVETDRGRAGQWLRNNKGKQRLGKDCQFPTRD